MINVIGGTRKQRNLVNSIATYCITMLGLERLRTLDVEIKLTSIKDGLGYCLHVTDREYEIEINKGQCLRRLLETVAHEMVHVKQYARKELRPTHVAWKGLPISPDTEYWDLPWEIEANGREVGLFIRWCQSHGYAGEEWTLDPF